MCVCVCVWNNCELPEHSFLNSFFHWVNQFSKYAFTLMFNLPHQQLGIKNVVGNLTWLKFSTSYHRTKIAVFSDFKSMLITFAIQFNVHLSPRTCLELISFGKSRLQEDGHTLGGDGWMRKWICYCWLWCSVLLSLFGLLCVCVCVRACNTSACIVFCLF